MSTKTIQLKCPTCLSTYQKEFTPLIDGALDPKVHEMILSGEFFERTCDQCKATHQMPLPLLYIHSKQRYGIYLYPQLDENIEHCARIFAQINDEYAQQFPNYSLRIVGSIKAFVEKLTLWQDKKQDGMVELVKLLSKEALNRPDEELTIQEIYYYHYHLKPHLLYITNKKQWLSPYSLDLEQFVTKKFATSLNHTTGTFLMIDSLWAWKIIKKEGDLNDDYAAVIR